MNKHQQTFTDPQTGEEMESTWWARSLSGIIGSLTVASLGGIVGGLAFGFPCGILFAKGFAGFFLVLGQISSILLREC